MTTVDASIPLSFQAPQIINPAQLVSMRNAQQDEQLRRQMMQMQLAAFPQQQAQERSMNAASIAWLQQRAASAKLKSTEEEQDRTFKRQLQKADIGQDVLAGQLNAYKQAVAGGATPDQAKQIAMQVRKDKLDDAEKLGLFSPEEIQKFRSVLDFDPIRTAGDLTRLEDWVKQQQTQQKAEVKPPPMRKIQRGTTEVDQEFDEKTRAWKDVGSGPKFKPSAEEDTNPPKGDFDKGGEEFLKTLPKPDQELVKGIAEGRINPTTSASIRGGQRKALMEQVTQYDPTYNAARPAVWKDFTSGKTANNITAINTAIGHLGTLNRLGEALNNNDVQRANQLMNAVSTETGHPNVNNYEIAQGAVGDELMRVFRQVGASENEANDWKKKFDAMKSPKQIKGAVATATELLESRINALQDQWKRGSGSDKPFPNLVSPKSRKVLADAGIKIDGEETAKAADQPGTARISNDSEYNALPSGTVFIGPDGKTRRKP